jgi:hypothetical protein
MDPVWNERERPDFRVPFFACACFALAGVTGCGADAPPPAAVKQPPKKVSQVAENENSGKLVTQREEAQGWFSPGATSAKNAPESGLAASHSENDDSPAAKPGEVGTSEGRRSPLGGKPQVLAAVDEDRIAAQGISKIAGSRLTLYTDLPVDDAIEELPRLFEQALPQWCDYFQVDQAKFAEGHVRGCLMKDKAPFVAAGLLPAALPPFANGFTRGNEIWWLEQDTDYYRTHLMLHESTHAFMYANFGTCGPPWYMEGLAELLATHRLTNGKLTLGQFPASRHEVPNWGRIKLVRGAVQSGRPMSLDEILAYSTDAYLKNEAYGWSWAVAAFLDGHPRYRDRFRALPGELEVEDFNRQFRSRFADDWPELSVEWQVFIHELDYGYDLARNAVKFGTVEPAEQSTITIAADRGWQSSGVRVEPGSEYNITATGRYQLADAPKVWWCEPDGVTIRYHRGRPLGILLAMVVPDDVAAGPWPDPIPIGAAGTLSVQAAGTLFFKINDSPSELSDNAGSLEVTVAR